MKLLIVRHAIALDRDEWAKISKDDGERPINEVGAKKMKKVAKGLVALLGEEPSYVISSPLLRAKQTADLLLNEMPSATFVETEILAPGQDPQAFVSYLRTSVINGTELVACVGHEPHLNRVVSWLVSKSRNGIGDLKKGGACLLEFKGDVAAGKADLVWLMTSRQLRAFAKSH